MRRSDVQASGLIGTKESGLVRAECPLAGQQPTGKFDPVRTPASIIRQGFPAMNIRQMQMARNRGNIEISSDFFLSVRL